ncbi:hypothetical protein [Saccharolobus caldissimus]|uniref:Uncharacterized protein n=1 Tax=Saccharolobus caldissimus TaxID=1702097 RepID=A0AAQ4CVF2_9CREN|nr:hypothetical protein [Saccharolobus caldissimus]BDB99783.1 hypothetical protein SACC_28000 [Saccharolobus caldissimus]
MKEVINYARSLNLNVGYPDFKISLCYASMPTSFVIRSDGKLSKCALLLDSEVNVVGELSKDGSLKLDLDKIKWWSRDYLVAILTS